MRFPSRVRHRMFSGCCGIVVKCIRWNADADSTSLYLHVEVEDVLEVDKLDALADLAHENGAGSFRQDEIVVNDPLKQLAAFDPAKNVDKIMQVLEPINRLECLQFEEEADLLFSVIVGVVELDEARIAQRFHNLHFTFHIDSVSFLGRLHQALFLNKNKFKTVENESYLNEFGGQSEPGALFATLVDRPELSPIVLFTKNNQVEEEY